ncbi:MAG: glycerol kinase GlpK [Gemmataceae bacterium]|nr:glycerol kinase GlpK [Gemmata sp.]MDW8198471.1 glycerol kinase GlpK [Gemmataceae bacterium]
MTSPILLAIDQGTTSSRAIVYDAATFQALASAQQDIEQHYPHDGWVEHEPEDIWYSVARTVREALAKAGRDGRDVHALGITNQRETLIAWDHSTGRPVHRAIVWQDRRTTDFCRQHAADQAFLSAKTGLVLDPYFSATKMHWLLHTQPKIQAMAERGDVKFGTVDAFLIARLTGGAKHLTDTTNASRTLLFNIHTRQWDDDLLRYFGVPRASLPEVQPSVADFGTTRGLDFLPDGIPIRGVAGDQQAALFGQGCFGPGEGKCTYGTGAFYLLHTGTAAIVSQHKLLTTMAAMTTATPQYALEGAVFIAGAAVQWLRDGLGLFPAAADVERLAKESNQAEAVTFVPGLVGLGAPHWVPEARGVLFGLTRATTAADLCRAALEGVAFQVADLIDAADNDLAASGQQPPLPALKVDGGMARNDYFLQLQADILGRPVVRALEPESTALGAAFLAAIGVGIADERRLAALVAKSQRFEPQWPAAERARKLATWRKAVATVVRFYSAMS